MPEQENRVLTIKVKDLEIGMYVILPTSWFSHPFLKNQFRIESFRELQKLSESGLQEVRVDFSRSDIARETPADQMHTGTGEPELPGAGKWQPGQIVPRELTEAILSRNISPKEKAKAVKESSLVMMQRLLEDPSALNIRAAKEGIFEMVDFIISDDETSSYLANITHHDMYTYTHSVNVGILSVLLSKRLFRGTGKHNMRELGAGFFLHDLGKVRVDSAIINKQGRLSEVEWIIMKRHPEEGALLLAGANQISEESGVIVSQHHEREDGSGYPRGLKAKAIHPYARICSIADVFDALTAERSYKKKLTPLQALELMRDKMLGHFQRDLFENFARIFVA